MKPKSTLRSFLIFAGSSLLAVSSASAQIYWDGASASWNTAANWTTAAGAATPDPVAIPGSLDDTIFNRTGQNGNINIALDADQAALSLTFNSTGTTTIRGNTSGTTARALTIGSGGITKNSGSGAVGIAGGSVGVVNIALSANQTWTNNSASALSIGTGYISSATDANVALGAFNLIIDGTGTTNIGVSNQTEAVLTGSGTLTKSGTGVLQMGGANSGYSGNVFINGGVVNTGDATANATGTGNILINGGVLETRWSTGISRAQGTLANQIQITGGVSGLSGGGASAGAATHNIGAITWGSGTFNPTEFVLQSGNAGTGTTTLSSAINLNGDDPGATPVSGVVWRTIRSNQGNLAGSGTFSGAITNSGTTNLAGLIKTGVGQHILSGTNTYDGGTQVNQGILTANTTAALPGWNTSGKVTVAANATLGVRTGASWTAANIDTLRGAVTWSAASSRLGIDTTAGNFSYGSNITEALTLNKIGTNILTLTGTNTYTGGTILTGGTLSVGSATAVPSTGTISFNGGAIQSNDATLRTLSNVIAVNSDITVGTTGNLTFSDTGSTALGATRTFTINGGNTTFAQAFTGSGFGITKAGVGTLTLTGANTYTGTTTLNGGAIVLNNGSVTGSTVSFTSNTSLSILGGSGVSSTWNAGSGDFGALGNNYNNIQMLIDGAGSAGSAVLTVNNLLWGRTASNSTITLTNGGQMNVNGEVRIGNPYYNTNGNSNITIGGGTATSTLTGNTGQDFYIGFGERENSNNNVVTVNSGGVLTSVRNMFVGHVNNQQGNDLASTANKLTVTGTGTASMTSVTVGYAQQAGAPPTHPVEKANANVVEVTSGGTLTTSGINYIGRAIAASTEANANTLTVTGTGSSWNAGSQNVFVGFTTNASAVSNNNILTVGAGGTVTGIAALTVGSGTGTETGNQLVVNGNLTATSVSVSANNTLAGNGTITGPVTVNGTVAPGTSIGTLSVTGNTTIAGTLQIEVDGGSVDLLAITGNANISAATLSILPIGAGATLSSYTLLTYTGTLTPASGPFFAEGTLPVGYSIDYSTPGQIKLVNGGGPTGYAAWQATNSAGPNLGDDHDNDGVDNGTEYFIGGPTGNTTGFTALPGVINNLGNLSVTWTKAGTYTGTYGTSGFEVQTSSTLAAGTWTAAATSGTPNVANTVYINGNNVTYTFPAGTKNFARLKVTGP